MTPPAASDELAKARAKADENPDDVEAQIEAAYACDRAGLEDEAIVYYDAAALLGGAIRDVAGYMCGYGSTLRNVGRIEESVTVLIDACHRFPLDQGLRTFLGLALHSAGRHEDAVATLIDAVLMNPGPEAVRYARALAYYRDALRK